MEKSKMYDDFLTKAQDQSTNSFVSESKILERLYTLGKAVVITTTNLDYIAQNYASIRSVIEKLLNSKIWHLDIIEEGINTQKELCSRNIADCDFHNLVDSNFKSYKGYCFVMDSGIHYLLENGRISQAVEACLQRTQNMIEQLKLLYQLNRIEEVFDHFCVSCKHGLNYNKCFDSNGIIYAHIKEQELRNMLLDYLRINMKGSVQTEFCTDFENVEESVDIYLNDGIEEAIIEVKFSFQKEYYNGKTNYAFEQRVKAGFEQLDKYAKHLDKDGRQMHYGYLYIFYKRNDLNSENIAKIIENELSNDLSAHFRSLYTNTITNDLGEWKCC